jgi:hypothetical protein
MKIVRTKRYLRDLRRLGATEDEIAAIEQSIASNPTGGAVIPGLGGVRKIRFGLSGRGKRGGGRAIYFLMMDNDTAVMLFAFAKNEQEDLTSDQRRAALALIEELKDGQ